MRRRALAAQTVTTEQDVPDLGTKMACTQHLLEYYQPHGSKAGCPACELERRCDDLKVEALGANKRLEVVTKKLEQVEQQVNMTTAIRSAIEVLDDNDYLWLKTQLYQYKIDKSVTLKPTHGQLTGGRRIRRGEKLPANGFMAMPRGADPYAHQATSIGGVATAEYLDEAISTFGISQAMAYMLRAWWKVLPGGAE